MDRLITGLETVVAGINKGDADEMLAGLPMCLGGNGHAAWGGNRFKADGDVDIIPEHLVFVGHHIAHVDAQTELHDPIGRDVVVSLRLYALNRDASLDCPDIRLKL